MSECCSVCKEAILDYQDTVKCAGPCAEIFHVSCAQADAYLQTRGVLKDSSNLDHVKNLGSQRNEMNMTNYSRSLPVTEELFYKVLNSFRQDIINELDGSIEKFKNLSDNRDKTEDSAVLYEIKKELSTLRIQNEVLRNENEALVSRVKALESKVNSGDKMFDEFRKLLRNLSKNGDKNNNCLEDIKNELKQVRILSENLEDENADLIRQFNVVHNKVSGLENSVRNITEKNTYPRGLVTAPGAEGSSIGAVAAVAERQLRPSLQTIPGQVNRPLHLDLALPLPCLDNRIVSMTGTTKKHMEFAVQHMVNKPVTSLAGIGPVLGGRLSSHGYHTASHVYQQFLALNKNKAMFQAWLKSVCNANVKQSGDCYQCLYDWSKNFD